MPFIAVMNEIPKATSLPWYHLPVILTVFDAIAKTNCIALIVLPSYKYHYAPSFQVDHFSAMYISWDSIEYIERSFNGATDDSKKGIIDLSMWGFKDSLQAGPRREST